MKLISKYGFLAILMALVAGCASPAPVATPTPTEPTEQVTQEAVQDKTLIVHYVRYDENYEPWNLWLWAEGAEGSVYEFTESDDFGVVARATIPNSAEAGSIGFIVRTNDWTKDVAEDRFVDVFDDSNTAEIWLVEADPTIYFELPEIGPKMLSANIDSLTEINISLNEKLDTRDSDKATFTLITEAGDSFELVAVSQFVNPEATEIRLELPFELNLGQSYRIASDYFGERAATPRRVFGSEEFAEAYHFDGELGPIYSRSQTTLRVWAPTATSVSALLYESVDGPLSQNLPMQKGPKGTWSLVLSGDRHLQTYTYLVTHGNRKIEAVDPYVKSASINGKRGVVLDMERTNPANWPFAAADFSGEPTDAVFYELHVRDLGMDASSGITNRGKFVSLMESGTKTPAGGVTGIDAIVDLGVTHLQLLPIYDYASIDETRNDQFNWGYDPLNFNVPEGSYATDPSDPVLRVRELKETIAYLNSRGLRVVMDVVYNHVYDVTSHSFQKIVPGYYFRTDRNGNWANGTGVGNEVASERSMARKFIVESASYWASEYRLGGFRFDLMGIHDVETMNQIRAEVSKIDPTFIIIGEGWNMGNILDSELKANQLNAYQMPGIAHFNDGIRDGIKGSVFNSSDNGWATGKTSARNQVMEGIVGQINFGGGIGGQWGEIAPSQSVSYVEAHDNLTLHDKLVASVPGASEEDLSRIHRFASSIALLAQGIAFIHSGQEFERSKGGDENSYKSPDSVNALRWAERPKNITTVNYFKGLIELRKEHPVFRMRRASDVKRNLEFFGPTTVIAYELDGKSAGDSWSKIVVIHNPNEGSVSVDLPAGDWSIAVEGERSGTTALGEVSGAAKVAGQTTTVLFQD